LKLFGFLGKMARVTGLEPAASGVTGRRSNQLSYTRVLMAAKYDTALPLSMAERKESIIPELDFAQFGKL
jgi:hypothetical protein